MNCILIGDVRARLRELPSDSVHCAVTSPPYFGLRDYGCAGQIGLEASPAEYIAALVDVFRELRRVLRDDGTLWLNLGDSYGGPKGNSHGAKQTQGLDFGLANALWKNSGTISKQRLMIPARVALALQSDGWWLRDEIIWHKPNPMPVSVTDRTTPAHEMLYMFSKSARYHYDMEAIKEPAAVPGGRKCGPKNDKSRNDSDTCQTIRGDGETRQPRSVWTVTPKPFKGAHFATFPSDLIRPAILAGCPIGGTVLDPFFGSGTTGLVAASLQRFYIGIDLNPAYAAMAAERLGLVELAAA